MFKNQTILRRLGISFGMMLGLLLVCAGVGIVGLNILHSTARHVISTDEELAQHAARIDILLLNERRFEKDTFINIADSATASSYADRWRETKATLLGELSASAAMELGAEDRQALEQIAAGFQTYAQGFEGVLAAIQAHEIKSTQDANLAIGRFKPAVHAMEGAAESLNQRAIERGSKVLATLFATRNDSLFLQLGIVVLCLVLGVIMCLLTTRSITRPLDRAIGIAQSVSKGKLDNEIDASGHNEMAQLLGSLQAMQEVLLENELNAKGQITAINKTQAVAEFTLEGVLTGANENFLRMYGYGLGEILQRNHSMFVDSSERQEPGYRGFWTALARGESCQGRFRRIAKSGHELYIQANYSPILNQAGKPYKVVQYASDVTDQVRMQEALDLAVRDTGAVVQAAMEGDLTRRLDTVGKSGQIEALMTSVNALLGSMMSLVATIKQAAEQVLNGAEEISAGNLNLSQRTEESAASLEETASSMEEMTSAVKTSAENAAQARELS
jgi:PAS domain S-box-containing protein